MAARTERYRELWSAGERLSTVEEADRFFVNLERSLTATDLTPSEAGMLKYTALQNLMQGTREDADAAGRVILQYLVPLCLSESGEASLQERVGVTRFRELLHDWIEQYPEERRLPLRNEVLLRVLRAAAGESPKPALWTLADVGFRSPQVVEAVRGLAERDDDVGDTATDCLAALGPDEELRRWLVRQVLDRLPRREAAKFDYVIQELADPAFLPALERRAAAAATDQDLFSLTLLGRIADARPGDAGIQGRVWAAIEQVAATGDAGRLRVLSSGAIAAACDLPRPVRALLGWLPTGRAGRHLIYYRLEDCIRPGQLEAWADGLEPATVATVMEDATRPADPGVQRAMTAEHRVKNFAWDVALCAGVSGATGWLSEAVAEEPNPYVQHSVMDQAACLAAGELPAIVLRLVRERWDKGRGGDDPTLLARIAAAEVARSAATVEAFEALLDSGLTLDGYPLRSTADAVADVATALTSRGWDKAVEALLKACEEPAQLHRRLLAIRGLEGLSEAGLLPGSAAARIVRLAGDDALPTYARARLVVTLGRLDGARTLPDLLPLLLSIAGQGQVDPELRYQSLDTLSRLGPWREHEPLYAVALGLTAVGGTLRPTAPGRYTFWQGYLLARLLPASPELLSAAAAEVVAGGGGDAVHQLLGTLIASVDGLPVPVREAVAAALVGRINRTQGRALGETSDFSALARLSPGLYVTTPWEDLWGEWMPAVRAAFCDALGTAGRALVADQAGRVVRLLEDLLSDSSYAVRRAAARALSRIHPRRLAGLCGEWERSGQTDLCRRAAEAAGWLPLDREGTLDNEHLWRLSMNPEASVRSAASAARKAARERAWAALCLARTAAARDDGNQWVLSGYRYGQVLGRHGDDETIAALEELSGRPALPPNVRHWLRRIMKDLEKGWRRAVQDWPEPWLAWSGSLEEVDGVVVIRGESHPTRLSLWLRRRRGPSDLSAWGGACRWGDGWALLQLFSSADNDITIEIPGRRPGKVWISSSGSDNTVIFVGTGPYPEPLP